MLLPPNQPPVIYMLSNREAWQRFGKLTLKMLALSAASWGLAFFAIEFAARLH